MTFLPPKKCPERETAIIDAVSNGQHEPLRWSVVRSSIPGHTATFIVMADALRLDVETKDAAGKDWSDLNVRANVTAHTSQVIADILDCSMLTAKLADLIWDQADVHALPCTMVQTEADTLHMSDTTWMIDHSERIDRKLPANDLPEPRQLTDAEKDVFGVTAPEMSLLVSTVGKHWIIEEELKHHPGMACNYGWHFSGSTYGGSAFEARVTGNGRLIQGRGYAHNPQHVDYSQTLVLVQNVCLVDGLLQDLRGLLQDPDLAKLANQSGTMTYLRQSGVPTP